MDGTVVLASIALSLSAGLFVGLFPLASVSKIGITDALHEESCTDTTGKKSRSMRQLLVAAQIGFAFALLVRSRLLLPSFRLLLQVDPWFNPKDIVPASAVIPHSQYP